MCYSQDYRLGHETLDSEHQLLFGLIAELQAEIQAGRGQAALGDLLQRFFMYAVMHFATEDRLMMEVDYPDAHAHRADHQRMLASLKRLEANCQAGAPSAPEDTLRFTSDWARGHLSQMDRKLVEYLASQVGSSPNH